MDFSQTVRVLVHRWYVAVPVFLAAVGIAGLMAYATPHQYQSTGAIVLTQPNPNAVRKDGTLGPKIANPLMTFADSLTTTSELLIQSLNGPAAQQQVQQAGGVTTFTASDGGLTGPYIIVTANSAHAGDVQRTVSLALHYAGQQLVAHEKALGAPAAQYIVVKSVVAPTEATQLRGGKSRFALATGILALVASLTAVFAVETVSRRRAQLKAAA
jgi:hypothetical protein